MASITERGLRRTVGVPGLFATAYGNVGSSIYYALGLVAAHALGLTPLVFMFAGGLFALTAKTYAEGASMFPEAGGSSSFARHAFNEVVSFFAGWALTLDYIITIAICAFFVPHYLGRVLPGAAPQPGRHHRRHRRDRRCSPRLNIRGPRRVGQAQPRPRGRRPRAPRSLLVVARRRRSSSTRRCSSTRSTSAPRRADRELIFALSVAMVAYTGIETVSNMAEEAQATPATTCPRRSTSC